MAGMNVGKLSESLERMSALLERHDERINRNSIHLKEFHDRLVALEIIDHMARGKSQVFKVIGKWLLEFVVIVLTVLATLLVAKMN